MSMATAPAPPDALAGPGGYTAASDATTIARRPSQARDSIQLTALKTAAVAPRHALTQSTPCGEDDAALAMDLGLWVGRLASKGVACHSLMSVTNAEARRRGKRQCSPCLAAHGDSAL